VTDQLYQDLIVKEEALNKLQVVFQKTKKAPCIATVEANTMTYSSMVKIRLPRSFLKRP
jgi:hypothetical protein